MKVNDVRARLHERGCRVLVKQAEPLWLWGPTNTKEKALDLQDILEDLSEGCFFIACVSSLDQIMDTMAGDFFSDEELAAIDGLDFTNTGGEWWRIPDQLLDEHQILEDRAVVFIPANGGSYARGMARWSR